MCVCACAHVGVCENSLVMLFVENDRKFKQSENRKKTKKEEEETTVFVTK